MSDNRPTLSTDAIADSASSVIGAAEEDKLERMYEQRREATINRLIAVVSLIVSVVSLIFSIMKA